MHISTINYVVFLWIDTSETQTAAMKLNEINDSNHLEVFTSSNNQAVKNCDRDEKGNPYNHKSDE